MSSATSTFSLDDVFGGLEVTQNIAAILLGFLTVQTYTYFQNFSRDALGIKIVAILIWALEVVSYNLGSRLIYLFTVTDWGNPAALASPISANLLSSVLFVCATNLTLVKLFYIFRIYTLSHRRLWLTACLLLSASVVVVWYAGWMFLGVQIQHKLNTLDKYYWLFKLELGFGLMMEIVLATVVAYYLRQTKFPAVEGSMMLASFIVRWATYTGAITVIVSVVNITKFASDPNIFLLIGLVSILSKVYSNCLIASLNGRGELQNFSEMRSENASISHRGPNVIDKSRNLLGNFFDVLAKGVRAPGQAQEQQEIPLHNSNLQSGGRRHQTENAIRTSSLATTSIVGPGPVSIRSFPPPPALPQPSSPSPSNSILEMPIDSDTPLTPNRRSDLPNTLPLTRRESISTNYTAMDSVPSYRSQPAPHSSIGQVIDSGSSPFGITEVPRQEYHPSVSPQTEQIQSLGRWPTNSSMRTYTTLPGYKSPTVGSELGG
ncbi:hypothetical protein K435DRAFT_970086 [Dendrothele bispora CBS 962.96]|uniref:DUF6534 domain-containing protein n=1 Tax=Dendrothele bispora (strain CBS 962.96) TaxID=1314807 RepID=A0A4S8LEX5_DENBC|nr:hypothetical protein K435DRAFT_970086 [Dendrothele bispora CBS 962.96]